MALKSFLRSIVYQTEKLTQQVRFAASQPQMTCPFCLAFPFPKAARICSTRFYLDFQMLRHSRNVCIHSMPSTKAKADASAHPSKPLPGSIRFARVMLLRRISLPAPKPSPAFARQSSSLILFFATRVMWLSRTFFMSPIWKRVTSITIIINRFPISTPACKVSILGRPDSNVEFPDIAERFAPYLGWLDHPEVLTIHFEDLIQDRAATSDPHHGPSPHPRPASRHPTVDPRIPSKHPSTRKSPRPSAQAKLANGKNISPTNIKRYSRMWQVICW